MGIDLQVHFYYDDTDFSDMSYNGTGTVGCGYVLEVESIEVGGHDLIELLDEHIENIEALLIKAIA